MLHVACCMTHVGTTSSTSGSSSQAALSTRRPRCVSRAMAAGIAIGAAAIGAALGQGRGMAAAMESIGRNPNAADRLQTPMILGLAFIEALAIYAFVIAFLLQGQI